MDLQLHGLRALVTGGSAGIGAAIVRALAAEGCEVAFCARQPERLQACLADLQAAGLPGALQARALDVCQPGAFEAWLEELGSLDILVLNVSALSSDWAQALDVDLRATVRCAEAALPLLRRSKHGALTYIGSKAGSLAAPNSAAYGAAKAALAHYMKSLSARVLPEVRVNTVSPGDTWVAGGLWACSGAGARALCAGAATEPLAAAGPPGRNRPGGLLCLQPGGQLCGRRQLVCRWRFDRPCPVLVC